MKKILLGLLSFSLIPSSFSADTSRIKPNRGTFTTQVGISLATLNNNVNSFGLNGRYFLKERLALRATLQMQNQKSEQHVNEFPDGTGGTGKYTMTFHTNFLMVGLEKHFKGTRRLSPYLGVEAGYGMGSVKLVGENSNGQFFMPDYRESQTRKINQMNLGAFLGFDYWIADGIYIGIEYSFVGFVAAKMPSSDKTTVSGGNTTHLVMPESKSNAVTTISSLPVFRLGWKF